MSRRRDHCHHHPAIARRRVGTALTVGWVVTCGCGMRARRTTWRESVITALCHSEGISA